MELEPAGQCIPEEKSTRTSQETSKKQGAESRGTTAQQASRRPEILLLEVRIIRSAIVHVSQIIVCLQSREKAEEKEGSFELEPQLCSSDCSSRSTPLSKGQSQPRTTVFEKRSGPGRKMVFKGVTFHLGTSQPWDPQVWGKQLDLNQGGCLP